MARRTAYYVARARPEGALSPDSRSDGLGADPRGDEQPRDLRLPPRVGDGEPDRPRRLQPQAHSARDAAARPDAGAARPPAAWPAPPRAGAGGGVESAVVLRRVPDPLLEWRGPLGGLRHRLPRPRDRGLG